MNFDEHDSLEYKFWQDSVRNIENLNIPTWSFPYFHHVAEEHLKLDYRYFHAEELSQRNSFIESMKLIEWWTKKNNINFKNWIIK